MATATYGTLPIHDADGAYARAHRVMSDYVAHTRLAVALLTLPEGTVVRVSQPLVALLGGIEDDWLGRAMAGMTDAPEDARRSLHLVANGTLTGYSRRITHSNADRDLELLVRVDACASQGLAVMTLLTAQGDLTSVVLNGRPGIAAPPVVGSTDLNGVIDSIASDDAGLLPRPPTRMLGQRLITGIHDEDGGVVMLLAAHSRARSTNVSGRVRLLTREGGWRPAWLTLQPILRAGSAAVERARPVGFSFALLADPLPAAPFGPSGAAQPQVPPDSFALWVAELPTIDGVPELSELSPRELTIVARLYAGERVPQIARDLFLGQSTVRNHLTSAYRKLAVTSQSELLARLRPQ